MSAIDVLSLAPPKPPAGLYLSHIRAGFERIPSLDGLRAISILLVMLSHYVNSQLFPGGIGVLIFFVVSGFLITRLMLAEQRNTGRVSLSNFYLRRFFRLYPVVTIYAAVVVVFFIATARALDLYEPASALFYFANYLYSWRSIAWHTGVARMPFEIFWSLSVEEHFYLVFPMLFVFLRGRTLVAWMAAVCIACLVLRLVFAQLYPEWLNSHFFYYMDVRLDSIAFGVLLAALCETPGAGRAIATLGHPYAVASAGAAILICLAIRNDWFRETLRYSMLGASVAVLLAAVLFSPRYAAAQTILNLPFLRWIGILSYSLYVWHTFVPLLLHQLSPALPRIAMVPTEIALALALATLSYYAIERPAAALRHRFGSRTAT